LVARTLDSAGRYATRQTFRWLERQSFQTQSLARVTGGGGVRDIILNHIERALKGIE
jgi:hypothetical protein